MNAETELRGRRILLGVSGGIAAYKSPELARRLQEAGAQVRAVMTSAAGEFIRPITLQAVTGEPVRQSLWDEAAEAAMGHIELARWADDIVIAPASADLIARIAHGLADDLLTTLCLASEARLWIAPAMNRVMWASAATRANVALLRERGARILGPGAGGQACGEFGSGRLLEPTEIVSALGDASGRKWAGRRVLITAGPTREAIDPVRFIGNRSSGRMGLAIAAAMARHGAEVTAVVGPSTEPTPPGIRRLDVESARDMLEAVLTEAGRCDIFIAAAAVADYRVESVAPEKIKKRDSTLSLELVRNPDILAEVAAMAAGPFTVGFAAETQDLETNALAKLRRKGLDMIAANWVGRADSGFDTARNALEVFWADGRATLPDSDKHQLAEALAELVNERFDAQRQAAST